MVSIMILIIIVMILAFMFFAVKSPPPFSPLLPMPTGNSNASAVHRDWMAFPLLFLVGLLLPLTRSFWVSSELLIFAPIEYITNIYRSSISMDSFTCNDPFLACVRLYTLSIDLLVSILHIDLSIIPYLLSIHITSRTP